MGHAIAKIAKEAWHGVKHVGEAIGHGVESVAKDVAHGAEEAGEAVYHVGKEAVDDVGTVLEKAADIATTVVVDVGGVAEHVVSIIPGIGGTLSNGLAGVMDLAQKYDAGVHDVIEIVKDPIAAVKEAEEIISNPSLLKSKLEDAANLIKGVAGDVTKVVIAAAALTPEGDVIAPELITLANVGMKVEQAAKVGGDLLSGNVSDALHAGMGFLPKSAQNLAKAVTASVDVAAALKSGNYNAAIKAATPFLPAKAQKGIQAFEKLVNKKTIMKKALEKVAGKKRALSLMQTMHSEGSMGQFTTHTGKAGDVYMLAFRPKSKVEVLDKYFKKRHPGEDLAYHVFLPGRYGPEWQMTLYSKSDE